MNNDQAVTAGEVGQPEIYFRVDAEKNSRSTKVNVAYSVRSTLPLDQHMALFRELRQQAIEVEAAERERLEGIE